MAGMVTRVHAQTTLDTDAVNPDALKAAFGLVVDLLDSDSRALNWNRLQFALSERGVETDVIARVELA